MSRIRLCSHYSLEVNVWEDPSATGSWCVDLTVYTEDGRRSCINSLNYVLSTFDAEGLDSLDDYTAPFDEIVCRLMLLTLDVAGLITALDEDRAEGEWVKEVDRK